VVLIPKKCGLSAGKRADETRAFPTVAWDLTAAPPRN